MKTSKKRKFFDSAQKSKIMKISDKVGVLFLILILISVSVLAQQEVDKAYSCLEGKVKGKCSSFNSEEEAFSLLALAYKSDIQSECKNALISNSKNNGECWPKSACTLRETSLAVLALNNIKANADKPENWLLSQNKTPDELTWYLEIDAKEATKCKIDYDNKNYTINMNSDKKLSGSAGTCLTLAQSNYWLQISQSCINKNFKVSCDKEFITALLYKKTGSDIWHVSSQTQAASANGVAENQVNAYCFKQNNVCNYEGSLWATLALQENHEITSFLPYLIALAPDNEKFSPYAFLYILTGSDEYLSNIRTAQSPNTGYWDLTSSYGKFYDTALSLLSLQELTDDYADKAKEKLLTSQDSTGCWQNSVRDTAFILYAAWPKPYTPVDGGEDNCEDFNYTCTSRTQCSDATGDVLDNFFCSGGRICCSKAPVEETCDEKGGTICTGQEECVGGSLVSAEGTSRCCIDGECEVPITPKCEEQTLNCRDTCQPGEEIKTSFNNVNVADCPDDKVCCGIIKEKPSYWWLWLLIILIIIVVLGIIFKDKLRVLLFKFKTGFKKGPVKETRPPFPPSAPSGAGMPRPVFRRPIFPQSKQVARPFAKPKSKVDEELEETLKKLKEMSK